MKKALRVSGGLLLLFLIPACLWVGVSQEKPRCNFDSLLLDVKDMPTGWVVRWAVLPPALDSLGAQQAYKVAFESGLNTASHTVYRYSNRWLAIIRLRLHKEVFFSSSGWDWSPLAGAKDFPLQADQWQIKCGQGTLPVLGNRCGAVLRYGPYLSDFGSSVGEDAFTIEEFEQIVLKIDDLFTSCQSE